MVIYNPKVLKYLNRLAKILYNKKYFGFKKEAQDFINKITKDIEITIEEKPKKKAPSYFSRYGKDLYYTSYRENYNTIWYVFFAQKEDKDLICFITNNHTKGKYILGL